MENLVNKNGFTWPSKRDRPQAIRLMILLIVGLGGWIFAWWFVLSRLQYGVDVSDTAYYLLSIFNHDQIQVQSTLFGPVWDMISPFEGILQNRFFAFGVLVFSQFLLSWAFQKNWQLKPGFTTQAVYYSVPATASLIYYIWWLPDPSYNLMSLALISFCWAALIGLLYSYGGEQSQKTKIGVISYAALIGLLIASLFLVKATSALVMGTGVLTIFLLLSWKRLSFVKTAILGVWAMIGIGMLLVLLHLSGSSPFVLYSTMRNGLETAFLISTPNFQIVEILGQYVQYFFSIPLLNNASNIIFTVSVILALILYRSNFWPKWRMLTFVIMLLINGYLVFDILSSSNISDTAILNWVFGALVALSLSYVLISDKENKLALIICVLAVALGPIAYSFGSSNALQSQLVLALGLSFVAANGAALALGKKDYTIFVTPIFALLIIAGVTAKTALEATPYRMGTEFKELQFEASIGPNAEIFLVTEKLAEFYNGLIPAQQEVIALAEPPLIIDLTGRTPMVIFQLGGKIPQTPWLLSGYPGSVDVFNYVLERIDPDLLQNAWIFYSPEYLKGFQPSHLDAFGLDFPNRYRLVSTVPVPYIGVDGNLYAPEENSVLHE